MPKQHDTLTHMAQKSQLATRVCFWQIPILHAKLISCSSRNRHAVYKNNDWRIMLNDSCLWPLDERDSCRLKSISKRIQLFQIATPGWCGYNEGILKTQTQMKQNSIIFVFVLKFYSYVLFMYHTCKINASSPKGQWVYFGFIVIR